MKYKTLIALLFPLLCWAEGTPTYYRKAEGLSGIRLKQALHDIIQPRQVLSYGGGEGKTWSGFWLTDQMDSLQVRDRYSDVVRYLNPDMSAVSSMNIEHIWANSWWGHLVNNAYCDLFNLYPADATANGRKSNNPIGLVNGQVAYTNGVTKIGKSDSYRTDSLITAWEPADQWKGDFARTYFYMATCYSHMTSLWTTTEGLLTVDPSSPLTMRPWVYNLMMAWAEEDPLDDIERERNEAIYTIQGNRNPFIDYPELCDYIWGDQQELQFYCAPEGGAEIFVPLASETIDFGLQPLSRPFSAKVQVRGRGLHEGLTLSTDNDAFALENQHLTPDQILKGHDVTLQLNATAAGAYQTMLRLEGSGYVQQTPLVVRFVDGIPAYEATDVVCSVSSRRFTANWMSYAPGETYTLSVYTKDSNGTVTTFGTYETTDTCCQVKNVAAATTYYYTVSLADGTVSNEVEVVMPEVAPVFSVSNTDIALTATPGKPSEATVVTITAIAVPKYVTTVKTTAPFELSTDGSIWSQEVTVSGTTQSFRVRFGGAEEEGEYELEAIVITEGMEERVIALSCSVDASKSFFEDFENGNKGGYAAGDVQCTAATWQMSNTLIGADDNAMDKKCVRMKGYTTSNGVTTPAHLMMTSDKEGGCDSLWFYAGLYGKDTGVKMTVSYSTDGGQTWKPIATSLSLGKMKRYGYELNTDGPIRLKFVNEAKDNKRVNIDNIQMSDYVDPVGIKGTPVRTSVPSGSYRLDGIKAGDSDRGIVIENGRKKTK